MYYLCYRNNKTIDNMENKNIYALTWGYEGSDNNRPIASTLAVSEDKETLLTYMRNQIAMDCRTPEEDEDEWDDDLNFHIYKD